MLALLLLSSASGSCESDACVINRLRGIKLSSSFILPGLENVSLAFSRGYVDKKGEVHGEPEEEVSVQEYLTRLAAFFVEGTEFQGKVNINGIPKTDHINIFVVDQIPRNLVPNFHENCSYIGYLNAIFCDRLWLGREAGKLLATTEFHELVVQDIKTRETQPLTDNRKADMQKRLVSAFITWVIGHEIGHSVRHKEIITKQHKQLHFDASYDAIEFEADQYVAATLQKDLIRGNGFIWYMAELIQQHYRLEIVNDAMFLGPRGPQNAAWHGWKMPIANELHVALANNRPHC